MKAPVRPSTWIALLIGVLALVSPLATPVVQATLLVPQPGVRPDEPPKTITRKVTIEDLEKLVAKNPTSVPAHELLGLAYLAKRDPVKATETFRRIEVLAPKNPRGPYLVGLGLRAQNKPDEARRAFAAALALAPGFAEALAQLVAMDLAAGQPDVALERVRAQAAQAPNAPGLYQVLGRLHEARREVGPAETAFRKAIELDSRSVSAYADLARLYAATGRVDDALTAVADGLKVNPRDAGLFLTAGTLHERKGNIPEAQDAYEKALAANPRLALAANNLAYLLVEHSGDIDRALELARTAKRGAPADPHVSDTLGWILYKRGTYQEALPLLRQSAAALREPVVQYHLGMAAFKAGDQSTARQALTQALSSPASFPGRAEAERVLAELK
jgi:tetratricopeptide (TPR) repeat protein